MVAVRLPWEGANTSLTNPRSDWAAMRTGGERRIAIACLGLVSSLVSCACMQVALTPALCTICSGRFCNRFQMKGLGFRV